MSQTNKVRKPNKSKCSYNFSYLFATRLKSARERRGLSQEKIAEKLGIEWQTYQHYESLSNSNVRVPNLEMIVKICNILQCDITYLTGENDEEIYEKELASAAIEIGLNYDTTEKLKNYSSETKNLLDRMITHADSDNLLKLLQSIYIYSLEAHHSNVRLDVAGADIIQTQDVEDDLIGYTNTKNHTLPEISKRMLRYSVNSVLEEVLNSTYKDYVDEANALLKERLNEKAKIEKNRCSGIYKKIADNEDIVTEDEWNLILDNKWTDSPIPTEEECHNRIDEKYNHFYDIYKEQNE